MITRIYTLSLCLIASLALIGYASTADVTKDKSGTCEVHNCSMSIVIVDCVPGGFSGYRTEFNAALRNQFPHHGRIHYSEDYGYMYASHLRIYVCPQCNQAYDKWLADNPNK